MILVGHITPESMQLELLKLSKKWHLSVDFLLKTIAKDFKITSRKKIKNICKTLGIKISGKNINQTMKIFIWIKAMNFLGKGFIISTVKGMQRDFKKYNDI